MCKICLDDESDQTPLISVCKCAGSVRFVHEECLKTWILSKHKDVDEATCEICKVKIEMSYDLQRIYSVKRVLDEGLKDALICIILLLIGFLVAWVMLVIARDFENDVATNSVLMALCGLVQLGLIVAIIKLLMMACSSI